MGARVVDRDYRGGVSIILFNFGNKDFTVSMGDKIAQLTFEKITYLAIREVKILEGAHRGAQGFSSTGVQSTDDCQTAQQRTN